MAVGAEHVALLGVLELPSVTEWQGFEMTAWVDCLGGIRPLGRKHINSGQDGRFMLFFLKMSGKTYHFVKFDQI